MMHTDDNKIEIRSEKARKLIGDIPSSLTYWGIIILTVVFVALAAVVCLVPYPYSNGESILRHILLYIMR
ncbi:MAG: hypothetical protein K2K93_12315 [Muribaculaceae bacterium]|nr:hypothetical protein [Muribaculaceae bacterium]